MEHDTFTVDAVPVEMTNVPAGGALSDGDRVRISGRWRRGRVRAERLHNLTTDEIVSAPDYTWYVVACVGVFALIIWAVVAFAVASG